MFRIKRPFAGVTSQLRRIADAIEGKLFVDTTPELYRIANALEEHNVILREINGDYLSDIPCVVQRLDSLVETTDSITKELGEERWISKTLKKMFTAFPR